ncbi:MAG: type II toxin-antitoxin system VapC family toxin [Acetobacteraceae bacterium]|nr:type II toxin-antitoxin system VapC family toxin [Acetobacteraceae bacterium]
MRITADTNLLVRPLVYDDQAQAEAAITAMETAALVAVPLAALCEMTWVLRQGYRLPRSQVAAAIRAFLEMRNTRLDVAAVEAGLAHLDAGGDFADGVIAHTGAILGGDVFVTFDRRAERLLREAGHPTRLVQTPPQP